jgi:hypothetical protein
MRLNLEQPEPLVSRPTDIVWLRSEAQAERNCAAIRAAQHRREQDEAEARANEWARRLERRVF